MWRERERLWSADSSIRSLAAVVRPVYAASALPTILAFLLVLLAPDYPAPFRPALEASGAQTAKAGTSYHYAGNDYTACAGTYCTGGPYALSVSFTTALTGSALDNLPYTDITSTITSFTFTDGSGLTLNSNIAFAFISTNASGNIVTWLISACGPTCDTQMQTNWDSPFGFIPGADFSETSVSFSGSYGFLSNDPGAWTSGTTQPLQITTTGLPNACGQLYSAALTATGGSGTGYTWSVSSGSLPDGFMLGPAGVLTSTGGLTARADSYSFTVQVTDSAGDTATQPLTLVVDPLNVTWFVTQSSPFFPSGKTMDIRATSPAGLTLNAAAQACGFAGFDWVQAITQWPMPSGDPAADIFAESAPTIPLTAPPKFADPPLGGYTYQFENPKWSEGQPNFADAYPYYYSLLDVRSTPSGCAFGPSANGCALRIMSDAYTLNFVDTPNNPSCKPPAPCIALTTQLVGICDAVSPVCDSSGPSSPLFQLTWNTNFNGSTGGIFDAATANLLPPDPGSGTGGITVTSINGIPLAPTPPPPPPIVIFPTPQPTPTGPSGSQIAITPSRLSFDSSPVGAASAPQTITVTNNGTVALRIAGVGSGSTAFAESDNCVGTLHSHASCAINVIFAPVKTGAQNALLQIGDNATSQGAYPQWVSLKGTATGSTQAVTAAPTAVSFGTQPVNTRSALRTISVTNAQSAALHITGINATGQFVTASNTCGSTVKPNSGCFIAVIFAPISSGAQTGTLTISNDATVSPLSVALSGSAPSRGPTPTPIATPRPNPTPAPVVTPTQAATATPAPAATPVPASAGAALQVTPHRMNLGKQAMGSRASAARVRNVVLFNPKNRRQDQTITIERITSEDDFKIPAGTCVGPLTPGRRCKIPVTFDPTAGGLRKGTLTIESNASNGTQIVHLTGIGE